MNSQRYAPENRKKNFLMPAIATIAIFAIWTLLGVTILVITGCGETDMTDSVIKPATEDTAMEPEGLTHTLGAMKTPAAVAAAPQAPGVGVPFVQEVSFYKDWKLTKEVAGSVAPGTTLFVKVVFSEAMQHIAADDKTARPILYYRVGGDLTRFSVKPHREKLTSGDAKPLQDGTDDFVCKYTVPEAGVFGVAVGRLSADLDGNNLAQFYTHKDKLEIAVPDVTPPTVVSVTYWQDEALMTPITDPFHGGDLYTKVVFSEAMRVSDTRPVLYYRLGRTEFRYRITETLEDGTVTTVDGITFVCRNTLQEPERTTAFGILVGKASADLSGNTFPARYRHPTLVLIEPEAPVVVAPEPTVAPVLSGPQEKAEKIVSRVITLTDEEAGGDFGRELEILEQETGLSHRFVTGTLISMYFEKFPEERNKIITWYDAVIEYLRLTFVHPNATEEELLSHYRQSIVDGRVNTDIEKSVFVQKLIKAQERARQVFDDSADLLETRFRASDREIDAVNQWRRDPQFDITAARERILMEEYGVTLEFADTLLAIHLDLYPEDRAQVAKEEFAYSPLVFQFFFTEKLFPEKSEAELLVYFRERISPHKVAVTLQKFLLE